MSIRKAKPADLDQLVPIYEAAKEFMHTHGNPNQWNDGHPNRQDLYEDMLEETLYVVEDQAGIQGCFKFYTGDDPTYQYIEGRWLNDLPYGVIHRVVSAGRRKGVGDEIIAWCAGCCSNLKVDTHADNIYMQRLVSRCGFVYCGTIFLENGDPRMAYQSWNDVEKAV